MTQRLICPRCGTEFDCLGLGCAVAVGVSVAVFAALWFFVSVLFGIAMVIELIVFIATSYERSGQFSRACPSCSDKGAVDVSLPVGRELVQKFHHSDNLT